MSFAPEEQVKTNNDNDSAYYAEIVTKKKKISEWKLRFVIYIYITTVAEGYSIPAYIQLFSKNRVCCDSR